VFLGLFRSHINWVTTLMASLILLIWNFWICLIIYFSFLRPFYDWICSLFDYLPMYMGCAPFVLLYKLIFPIKKYIYCLLLYYFLGRPLIEF
jgi:hypothetical protein